MSAVNYQVEFGDIVAFLFSFLHAPMQLTSKASQPPKWMADLENYDIDLLQGMTQLYIPAV